jgi:hypothetical protein
MLSASGKTLRLTHQELCLYTCKPVSSVGLFSPSESAGSTTPRPPAAHSTHPCPPNANDNLPLNRARDVQSLPRSTSCSSSGQFPLLTIRRSNFYMTMNQRMSELEEENACLRQELHLPRANRPLLWKGPTIKDKPKSLEASSHHPTHVSSRESLSVDSPPST